MHGGKGADIWSGPGGKFSLGRLERGSGYCVGAVVETRMGLGDDMPRKGARERTGTVAGNGLRDVWVIGESFWRSVGGVFDVSFLWLFLVFILEVYGTDFLKVEGEKSRNEDFLMSIIAILNTQD